MGDAGVDARGDAGLHHLADVDAGGGAAEAQEGDVEVLVLGRGDLVHLHGGVDGVLGRAADEGDDGRGRCHGKAADARGLGDGAVADIAAAIFGSVAGEVEALGLTHRPGEPLIAQAADTDAEIGAVAGHRRDHGAALHAMRGVGHGLARGHHRVQHGQGVVADGLEDVRGHLGVGGSFGDARRQGFEEDDGARLVAIVALIAHMQGLGQQGLDVHAAHQLDGLLQHGRHHLVHPVQAIHHFLVISAVAQHLAVALVHIAEGQVAVGLVLDDVDFHIGRGQARHRAHRLVLVAGLQLDFARLDQGLGLCFVFGPAFEDERAGDGALHRTGRPIPLDGRACVQQQVLVHTRDDVDGLAHTHQHRAGFHHTIDSFGIGFVDVHEFASDGLS